MSRSLAMSAPPAPNPRKAAEAGQAIYERRYRAEMERNCPGQFVVIDVSNEQAYPGLQPEEAIEKARQANPTGVFHLIRIGAPGAFRVSYTLNASGPRVLQRRDPPFQGQGLGV